MATDSLTAPIAELTSAVRSFTKLKQEEQATGRRMTIELPRVIREEFTAPMTALHDSIHELTTLLKTMHNQQTQATARFDDLMSHLTDRLSQQRTATGSGRSEGSRFWPKRALVSTQGPSE